MSSSFCSVTLLSVHGGGVCIFASVTLLPVHGGGVCIFASVTLLPVHGGGVYIFATRRLISHFCESVPPSISDHIKDAKSDWFYHKIMLYNMNYICSNTFILRAE